MTIEDMEPLTKYEQPVKHTHKTFYVALAQYDHSPNRWWHVASAHDRREIDDTLENYSSGVRRVRIYPVNLPIGDAE